MYQEQISEIIKTISFSINVLEVFDKNNVSQIFKFKVLLAMIEHCKPIGENYIVMSVYHQLAAHFGTSIYVIRSAFAKLRKAGLIHRVEASFLIGDGVLVLQDAFQIDYENILNMMGG